jgi:protein tyrosine phosphatase (PTP) superfamily phosphohydrolase (DUF442 family)
MAGTSPIRLFRTCHRQNQSYLESSLNRHFAPLAVIFLTTLCLAPSLTAQSGTPQAVLAAPRVGIDNFGQVNANYFRGAQPAAADYPSLAALGVKTIINLTSEDADPLEESMVTRHGMAYLQIPMTTRVGPTEEQLARFLDVVNDPASQPVYVHCVGGRHRTGVMTAVFRIDARPVDAGSGVQGDEAVQVRRRLPAPGIQAVRLRLSRRRRAVAGSGAVGSRSPPRLRSLRRGHDRAHVLG